MVSIFSHQWRSRLPSDSPTHHQHPSSHVILVLKDSWRPPPKILEGNNSDGGHSQAVGHVGVDMFCAMKSDLSATDVVERITPVPAMTFVLPGSLNLEEQCP